MNDITKARYFLKANNSKLQHLETFQLMLATADTNYKQLIRGKPDPRNYDYSDKEVSVLLDFAGLRYLKNHNQLPQNVPQAFDNATSAREKTNIAIEWFNS
jgi:hypothetical protein